MPTGPMPDAAAPMRGRAHELATLRAVAAAGSGRALVVHGEPGIGKTTLLDAAIAQRPEAVRVLRLTAVEVEVELPYAALHQLCVPLADRISALAEPQRQTLEAAFGLRATAPPSPFRVGHSTLELLSDASAHRPLLAVIDDAQWLDRASATALALCARRLGADGLSMLFATRELGDALAGLPTLAVSGLDDADARALLARAFPGRLDAGLREQVIAESRGNPLALHELPHGLVPGSRREAAVGGEHRAELARRIEDRLLARLQPLPVAARRLILVAAADPTGDPALLVRAGAVLGIDASAVEDVQRAGALTIAARVAFRHPLLRSGVYRAAPEEERRLAHAALAEAVGSAHDHDRWAWHRAQGTATPDETVAAALEHAALRARTRGGPAAGGAYLERAADLTPSPVDRARRLMQAAHAHLDAGAPVTAQRVLEALPRKWLSPRDDALADRLDAMVNFSTARRPDAALDLLAAARRLVGLDREAAVVTLAQAQYLALHAAGARRDGAPGPGLYAQVGRAALDVLDELGDDGLHARLIRGEALRAVGDRPRARAVMARTGDALVHVREDELDLRWTGLACSAAIERRDAELLRTLADRQLRVTRDRDDLLFLPYALAFAGLARVLDGRLDAAAALADEADLVREALGHRAPPYAQIYTAAWRGDHEVVLRCAARLREDALARDDGSGLSSANLCEMVVANGQGEYARAAALGAQELPFARAVTIESEALGELVEAAVRSGDQGLAEKAVEEITWLLGPLPTDWAQGTLARARALVATTTDAEPLYLDAMARFRRARMPLYAARTSLLYGEWLRRARRRVDARAVLRTARAELLEHGAEGFAARCARELEATGERARRRSAAARDALTVQERNVARLAGEGLSNRDIATRLFISVRTVEHHLGNVFNKLGIRSRRELAAHALTP